MQRRSAGRSGRSPAGRVKRLRSGLDAIRPEGACVEASVTGRSPGFCSDNRLYPFRSGVGPAPRFHSRAWRCGEREQQALRQRPCVFYKRSSQTWCNARLWKTAELAYIQIHAGSNRGVKARESGRHSRLAPRPTGGCQHDLYWKKVLVIGSPFRKRAFGNRHNYSVQDCRFGTARSVQMAGPERAQSIRSAIVPRQWCAPHGCISSENLNLFNGLQP